jgi:hypothetical protein
MEVPMDSRFRENDKQAFFLRVTVGVLHYFGLTNGEEICQGDFSGVV